MTSQTRGERYGREQAWHPQVLIGYLPMTRSIDVVGKYGTENKSRPLEADLDVKVKNSYGKLREPPPLRSDADRWPHSPI